MRKLLLALMWTAIVAIVYVQARAINLPFDPKLPGNNLRLWLHRKPPSPRNVYVERDLDEALAQWKLTGPIHLALPPMYDKSPFGNAGFLSSFINHGEVLLYNEPFPYPKLSITEQFADGSGVGYHFDNRSTNAALYVNNAGDVWPLGYTAWYDLVTRPRIVPIATPHLVVNGALVEPTAVRAVHPLNQVELYGNGTLARMQHLSPIVWTFSTEGRLADDTPGYAVESVADGAEVSYLPPLPTVYESPLGIFLLAPLVAPTRSDAPQWWALDQHFREAVLAREPVEKRRDLLRRLAAAYPSHPFLTQYRIIADFGGSDFDDTWLRAQKQQCELPSWYLVSWTHLPWSTVRQLPCLKGLRAGGLDSRGQYIAGSVVLAYRAERDDAELKQLAARVVERSDLRSEFRGFNFPLSDFAWLWLKARP